MAINGLDIQSVNNDRENNGQIENYYSQDDKSGLFFHRFLNMTNK